jgi:glycosyltransferase involved in cell wall biosynthesis
MKRRLLLVHSRLTSKGGGDAVGAWALQALREHYAISLATLAPVDCDAINDSFGTTLSPSDFELHVAPERYLRVLRAMPTASTLLQWSLTMRWAQTLDRKHHYDVLLGTDNAMDFQRRGLHYVHDLREHAPKHAQDMRWFHRLPSVLGAYHEACRRLARSSDAGLCRNVSLVNSEHTARRVRERFGVESTVLYPPVPGVFPDVPWSERRPDFVCVGRMHPEKRWELAVEIIERVRAMGHDTRLTLVAHRQNAACEAQLRDLQRTRPWFTIRSDLSRTDLAGELTRHRFGLHTMQNESFGIGPAEILRAGCVPFVHASGGPVEIVGHEPRLLFRSVDDAAQTIHSVLTSDPQQAQLRTHAAAQAARFSAAHFSDQLRDLVQRFLAGQL